MNIDLIPIRQRKSEISLDNKQNLTSPKIPDKLTKREMSQINNIYDPLGLAGPFTVRIKLIMRNLWTTGPQLR